jgi:two-component system response regulator AtoC
MIRVLVVDDDRAMCDAIVDDLEARGMSARAVTSADAAFVLLVEEDFDVVVTDLNMRGMSGVELCDRVVKNRPDVPVIVVTAFGSVQTVVATLRAGAFDFLAKPFDMDELAIIVERAVTQRRLRAEVRRLRHDADRAAGFSEMIGESAAMKELFAMLARVAESDATVLLTGETGTGKELAARAVHRHSGRRDGPFIAVNCAAMPATLLESELFGHARGAFTDARAERRGLFLEADSGTLFLDEIAEMAPEIQAKLLRALEERAVRPLGANREHPFDVRLVVATKRSVSAKTSITAFRWCRWTCRRCARAATTPSCWRRPSFGVSESRAASPRCGCHPRLRSAW